MKEKKKRALPAHLQFKSVKRKKGDEEEFMSPRENKDNEDKTGSAQPVMGNLLGGYGGSSSESDKEEEESAADIARRDMFRALMAVINLHSNSNLSIL